jgi:hypothetical protein
VGSNVDVDKDDGLHVSDEMDEYVAQSLLENDVVHRIAVDEQLVPRHVVCNACSFPLSFISCFTILAYDERSGHVLV